MARPTKTSESPAPEFDEDLYDASPRPTGPRRNENATQPSISSSPASSVSSDKENQSSVSAVDKGQGRSSMGPSRASASNEHGKRRRPESQDPAADRTRRRRTVEAEEEGSDENYDPDQSIEERRKLRKGLRDLSKNLQDNRTEYLEQKSTGLRDTLRKANELSTRVKQTSDATIDSRLLVTTADYSYKRTVALISGDSSQGIDLEEFVTKCLSFMRRGDGTEEDGGMSSTQRRRRQANTDDDDDEDPTNGETLNWGYLGRHACLKHNSRPSIPGFLLGPLSLEKRAKRVVVRKAAFKHTNLQETRPEVLQAGDIQKDENANLTSLCNQIQKTLIEARSNAVNAVEEIYVEDMPDKDATALMDRYNISQEGGVGLFNFVINPYSFGQTIENLFYVSFLVRDGKIGISVDDRGLPYLVFPSDEEGEPGRGHQPKHQAVLSLDMATWKDLIDTFDIKEPMIPHREEEEHTNRGSKGWYA